MKSHRCDFQTTEIYCRYSCLQLFFQFVHENRDECVATGNNETFVSVFCSGVILKPKMIITR